MRKLRLAIALFVLVAGVVAYLDTRAAIPYDYNPYACAYYATSDYKDLVGWYFVGCCGRVRYWGQVTQYAQCQVLNCSVLCDM